MTDSVATNRKRITHRLHDQVVRRQRFSRILHRAAFSRSPRQRSTNVFPFRLMIFCSRARSSAFGARRATNTHPSSQTDGLEDEALHPTTDIDFSAQESWCRALGLRARETLCADHRHATRTEVRKLLTSVLRRPLSSESVRAADSTCDEADPVSLAPRCTSAILADTC